MNWFLGKAKAEIDKAHGDIMSNSASARHYGIPGLNDGYGGGAGMGSMASESSANRELRQKLSKLEMENERLRQENDRVHMELERTQRMGDIGGPNSLRADPYSSGMDHLGRDVGRDPR